MKQSPAITDERVERVALLPCPFCGDGMEVGEYDWFTHADRDNDICPISLTSFSPAELEAWNTRAAIEALQPPEPIQDGLALCPLCGERPVGPTFVGDDDGGYHYVECPNNGRDDGHFCGVHGHSAERAVATWNARMPLPQAPEVSHD